MSPANRNVWPNVLQEIRVQYRPRIARMLTPQQFGMQGITPKLRDFAAPQPRLLHGIQLEHFLQFDINLSGRGGMQTELPIHGLILHLRKH